MASNLRVDTILPSSGTTLGIGTASGTINFLGNSNLTTTGDVTVGGNLGVGGTLTYEDVTNIDSVGVITARTGIKIGPSAGVAATIFSDGSINTSGIVTATSFSGSGANLTGLPASGLFSSYAIIADQKSEGTDGGSSTGGTWHTRDLNTELSDPDGIVSISSNQFTLQAGSYFIEARAPSYQPSRHRLKLYQTSGSAADVAFGTNEFMSYGSGTAVQTTAFLSCRITISTATTYEIRHYIQNSKSGNGLGVGVDQGAELYCLVKIFKES